MAGGRVIWITGLSGAGKSTLACEVAVHLKTLEIPVIVFDGDDLREVFSVMKGKLGGYERDDRLDLALRYARLCQLVAAQGVTVVMATISLFHEIHVWNRANLPGYFEVYLRVPLEELQRRDPKGLYRRFDAGDVSNVAGLDLAVDEPNAADWIAEFNPKRSVTKLARDLLKTLDMGNTA